MTEAKYVMPSHRSIGVHVPVARLELLNEYVSEESREAMLDCLDWIMAVQRGEPHEIPASVIALLAAARRERPTGPVRILPLRLARVADRA